MLVFSVLKQLWTNIQYVRTTSKSGHLSPFCKSCVTRLNTIIVLLIDIAGFRVTIRLDTEMESHSRIIFDKTQEASITSTIKVFSGDLPCTPAEEILTKVLFYAVHL